MAADSSEEKLSEDYIQETVRQLCRKLENSGDDCLFLRVTDRGTACSKLGTKNALLFERTQPQLTQEFRKFCSGLYSSLGVSLKSEGDLNDEDGGSVRPETVLTTDTQADSGDGGCDEMYDTGTCCQQTVLTTNKLEGGTRYIGESKDDRTAIFNSQTESKDDRTAIFNSQTESGRKKSTNKKKKTNINSENTKSKLTKNNRSDENDSTIIECAAVNTIGTQNKMDNSESRARPKRKMCTPSKLKLYETNFNKSSENSSGAKNNTSTPIEKSVRAVKGKVTKSCPKESLDKESKGHKGEGERRTCLGKKSKKSEITLWWKQKV
ncbi:uncharacterized protein LOC117315923 [Pecten maximus]|uniref:uncharacterized protein LOC117315923 n=1 Tax=Pecten maximus TaxID=6579 RepID=UPI00145808C3|nr:uncharacterized protein LOC117315923 [Pecten maximus]